MNPLTDTTDLKDVIIAYKKLSFSDQAAFYAMVPNDFRMTDSHLQSLLIETRITADHGCIYCGSSHVVKTASAKTAPSVFSAATAKSPSFPLPSQ